LARPSGDGTAGWFASEIFFVLCFTNVPKAGRMSRNINSGNADFIVEEWARQTISEDYTGYT
jgi:hypothetical protein